MMHVGHMAHSDKAYVNQNPSDPYTHQLVECFYITAARGPHSDNQFYGFMVCLAVPLDCNNGHMFTT